MRGSEHVDGEFKETVATDEGRSEVWGALEGSQGNELH